MLGIDKNVITKRFERESNGMAKQSQRDETAAAKKIQTTRSG
jgi:hypothetical protein